MLPNSASDDNYAMAAGGALGQSYLRDTCARGALMLGRSSTKILAHFESSCRLMLRHCCVYVIMAMLPSTLSASAASSAVGNIHRRRRYSLNQNRQQQVSILKSTSMAMLAIIHLFSLSFYFRFYRQRGRDI